MFDGLFESRSNCKKVNSNKDCNGAESVPILNYAKDKSVVLLTGIKAFSRTRGSFTKILSSRFIELPHCFDSLLCGGTYDSVLFLLELTTYL